MGFKTNKYIINFITLFLIISVYASEEKKIEISSSVDKSRIKIGDIINYKIQIIHDKNMEVNLPGVGANLGGFEIRDYEEFEPRKEKDKIISEAEYSISTFTTGEFLIPPLIIQYKAPEDTAYKQLATRKIEITVESMKPSEEGDIRDIKAPVEMPYVWWQVWGKWAVLGLGILLVAVAVYLVYQRKKQGKSIIPHKEPPPRPPHELALEALDKVKKSKLLEQGEIKKYYTELSDIIRAYFEGRYYIPALERTSGEILDELLPIHINEEVYELIKELLLISDMVKFAKVIPDLNTNTQVLSTAYTIVERTKVLPIDDTQNESTGSEDSNQSEEFPEAEAQDEVDNIQANRGKIESQGEK